MKKLSIVLVLVLVAVIYMFGQSYGSVGFGPIAPALSNCPAGTANTAQLCAVGTAASNYTMYVSYNGTAYQLLAPASSGVTSFNGRTGAVTLAKSDVTATGLAVASALQ